MAEGVRSPLRISLRGVTDIGSSPIATPQILCLPGKTDVSGKPPFRRDKVLEPGSLFHQIRLDEFFVRFGEIKDPFHKSDNPGQSAGDDGQSNSNQAAGGIPQNEPMNTETSDQNTTDTGCNLLVCARNFLVHNGLSLGVVIRPGGRNRSGCELKNGGPGLELRIADSTGRRNILLLAWFGSVKKTELFNR